MITSVSVPRLNSNEDEVTIAALLVQKGDKVDKGDSLVDIETDKSVFTIESPRGGYIIAVACSDSETVEIGKNILWIGDSLEEKISHQDEPKQTGVKQPTIKALQLLKEKGLNQEDVKYQGERLTVRDIEEHIVLKNRAIPDVAETDIVPLSANEKTMERTVLWQKQNAVPAYAERYFNQLEWIAYAKEVQKKHNLLFDPLLGLMAFHLVTIAQKTKEINSTVIEENRRVLYKHVNLGFAIQVKELLYLVVVKKAELLDKHSFLQELSNLQRKAYAKKLTQEDSSGATICFTSLAKWGITRHIPVLAPNTALILAHSASQFPSKSSDTDFGILGATYDHRLLTGYQVAKMLQELALIPENDTHI